MKKNSRQFRVALISVLVGTIAVASAAQAQLAPRPENLIKWRQSAFQYIAWNSGRIKTSLAKDYDKAEVIKAANAIAATANSGLVSLFAPGTEQGRGWHDTSAKPELFKDAKRFAEYDVDFAKQANELAKLAASADADAVKAQFLKLNQSCKTCHDAFKASD